ncbi:hypothetical protein BDV95DRAFT_631857 [Massariosphaeria phaeospora]|uniref:RBR-type E3 ubiquitin transferase n=1 Tax=Massariosphaeria phaeospora TaxID=100035 RepID=A0A7C8I7K7_9PLEO|nr:hypothetical protein BDV95DRAFT_631857 [Massariosphaeria phaeospora]
MDDELVALTLQLEEISLHSKSSKGKSPVNQPSDGDLAVSSYQDELKGYKAFTEDRKLAQSIASAVYTDGPIIADVAAQDLRSHEDRRAALQLSHEDPEMEDLPPSVSDELGANVQEWMATISETLAMTSVKDFSDEETEAGPSRTYAERQVDRMKKYATEFQCVVCIERFRYSLMVTAKCGHRYCAECIKSLFMRSMKDETLFPPRCCKEPVPLDSVAPHMSAEELASFKLASVELSTQERVYCSNRECGTFIVPDRIDVGTRRAICGTCGTATCSICKNRYHNDADCPDDPALHQTRELARDLGWQTCYACHSVVELRYGCFHMTCRCKAQFCYVCGVQWKNCQCPEADARRIEERAEDIVDREAPANLPHAERQQRVRQIQHDLEENHECEHPGKFQRVFDGPRRGFRCEMCDARHWKYILRCRHCYLSVCEECRRNRI